MIIDGVSSEIGDHRKAGAIYTKIKEELLGNRVRPNERLQPARIAERLKVSITPVREALQKLANENLVGFLPNHGYSCKAFELAEIAQLHEVALANLQYAIRKNVGGFSLSGLNRPAEWPNEPERETDSRQAFYANSLAIFIEQLYDRIGQASGNGELLKIIHNFIDRTHVIRILDLSNLSVARMVSADMDELIDALVSHDASKATANLESQIALRISRLPRLVREANAQAMSADPI